MKNLLLFGMAVCLSAIQADTTFAQVNDMSSTSRVRPSLTTYPNPARSLKMAAHDKFSPHPIYAYSRHGINSQRTHEWNLGQMGQRAWHGNYNYWRWQRPTALVVPPNAAFHTEYNWGVGQTRSEPIYHQFGRGGGMISNANDMGAGFQNTPYWPSSTGQFGVYPVRGPWHH